MNQSFGSWLKAQQHRDDRIGELAHDFALACRLRQEDPHTKTRDQVHFQMTCMSACTEAYVALDAAAAEWCASL